jgi:hypothetical protein
METCVSATLLIPRIPDPPASVPGQAVPGIDRYVGKSVEAFCPFHYGKVKDAENHCAHFVCHALGIQVGTTCESLLSWPATQVYLKEGIPKGTKGYTVRVNELYNSLKKKGNWKAGKADPCLIFATRSSNISLDRQKMGTESKKHVGYYANGEVWHYGNTEDVVKRDTLADFQAKFRKSYGSTVLFLHGVPLP